MDIAGLGVGNLERVIGAVAIGSRGQVIMELKDVIHESRLELLYVRLLPLAADKLAPRQKQVFDRNDTMVRMTNLNAPRVLPVIEHMVATYKLWFGYRDHFPKKSRYTLGERIDARFIATLELLYTASYQSVDEKPVTLSRALTEIDTLKFLFRIAWDLRILDERKYATISDGLNEIGRQTGGWKRGIEKKTPRG